MYTTKVPTYEIDLELDESERWAHVIDKEKRIARKLAREAMQEMESLPGLVRWLIATLYAVTGGRSTDEIKAWSEGLKLPYRDVLALNCCYELNHLGGVLPWPFGCTAAIRWVPGLGMVHLRSMDWPLKHIGNATRIITFRRGARRFLSVHPLGFVGVLSGMVPGAYSVTMNWLPPISRPTFNFGPAFLVREVLETCDTYQEAIQILRNTPLSTGVSFTVCGTKQGQACVIERTSSEAAVRRFKAPVLAQANHYNSLRMRCHNESISESDDENEAPLIEDSTERQCVLGEELAACRSPITLDRLGKCLAKYPVRNDESYQQMVFVPKTGDVKVWRYLTD